MSRIKLKIEVVPLSVARRVLAEELKQKRVANQAKRSNPKLAKSGQK